MGVAVTKIAEVTLSTTSPTTPGAKARIRPKIAARWINAISTITPRRNGRGVEKSAFAMARAMPRRPAAGNLTHFDSATVRLQKCGDRIDRGEQGNDRIRAGGSLRSRWRGDEGIPRPAFRRQWPASQVILFPGAGGTGPTFESNVRALADMGYLAIAASIYDSGADLSTPESTGANYTGLLNRPELLRARVVNGSSMSAPWTPPTKAGWRRSVTAWRRMRARTGAQRRRPEMRGQLSRHPSDPRARAERRRDRRGRRFLRGPGSVRADGGLSRFPRPSCARPRWCTSSPCSATRSTRSPTPTTKASRRASPTIRNTIG